MITGADHEGHCMRCRWPNYSQSPVGLFYLGNFQARLCPDHASELIQQFQNWIRELPREHKPTKPCDECGSHWHRHHHL